jgi:hypothetical protein
MLAASVWAETRQVNFQAMIARTRGMIVAPDATLAEHANPPPPIGVVVREQLLPLLLLNALAAFLLLLLFAPPEAGFLADPGPIILALAGDIGFGIVGVWIMSVIVRYHAGRLGGSNDPRAAFVLTALAMSPVFIGFTAAQILALASQELAILLMLAGAIYIFMVIYRGSGMVLGVPDKARGRHIASVIVTQMLLSFVIFTLIAMIFTPGLPS